MRVAVRRRLLAYTGQLERRLNLDNWDGRQAILRSRITASFAMVDLAIIIPTFNERENIRPLLASLDAVLGDLEYEVIFVDDDSTDGTAALIRELSLTNLRVRVLQRIGRRGLASACVEGMLSTAAPCIAVMDADLQHDESILPEMLAKLCSEPLDLVVATRNAAGGSMGEFSALRIRLSDIGKRLSNGICHCSLSDPMSGFFILDRRFLEEVVHLLSGIGFKILLDLVASSRRPVRIAEVPYRFRERVHGESKLDTLVGIEYLQLLLDKKFGDFAPPQFFLFSMVGGAGALVHLSVLFVLLKLDQQSFLVSQTIATYIAMTMNFFLNNMVTYRDRRLRGAAALIWGLLSFYLACSIGAFINIRVANFIWNGGVSWYLAGAVGVVVSSVWNYAVTAMLTWRRARRNLTARPRPAPLPTGSDLSSAR
ncbi:MAG TPA: glycosyltransferase family 2 protein [Bryobacteraceae bacterium]|nr:glycosyltransferase family 2 protein [Bryobacteraceae bacterium]